MTMIAPSTPPTRTDRRIIVAAIARAAGHTVTTLKLPCSPRCAWNISNTPQVRALVDAYDSGRPVPVPQSAIWAAYRELVAETKQLQAGRLAGGR